MMRLCREIYDRRRECLCTEENVIPLILVLTKIKSDISVMFIDKQSY
jgi:hypothetical protein